ncbi:RDD family protein [Hahella ganghwensis]|uniref:RDD family protein n=1 Tax=Hahella ganghwensis TaxID=286420 RepID=UPI00036FA464|nr:RDD family protein [Hahella ganghwensis]
MPEKQKYGVVYQDKDYAGFFRRMAGLTVDISIVMALLFLGVESDTWAFNHFADDYTRPYLLYASLIFSYLYLTIVRASSIGSIGLRLSDTRIETIFGKKPGLIRMSCRLLFLLVGPLNILADIFFINVVRERRSIRDCFCNTIVVRRAAVPIERNAPVHIAKIYAFGLNLMYESCNSAHT